jgi:hypothetical protein
MNQAPAHPATWPGEAKAPSRYTIQARAPAATWPSEATAPVDT